MNLDIFLDPETEEPLDYLIADGESQALNKVKIQYNSTPLPNHTISWKFKFWKYDTILITMDSSAQIIYNKSLWDLEDEEWEGVFNLSFEFADPDYEGTSDIQYGSITPTSQTNQNGIATSIFTAGTEAGFIEIWVCDNDFRIVERGSFHIRFPWRKGEKGQQKPSAPSGRGFPLAYKIVARFR
ncbi:MAG TPA: hypothetical protein PKV21_05025 [bacterium]|nr:hypothetical protein [bacterium]HOM26852.1 hypothetical protein [bacterium]